MESRSDVRKIRPGFHSECVRRGRKEVIEKILSISERPPPPPILNFSFLTAAAAALQRRRDARQINKKARSNRFHAPTPRVKIEIKHSLLFRYFACIFRSPAHFTPPSPPPTPPYS